MEVMCNLAERIEEKALKKGIAQGKEQGIEQGIEKGVFASVIALIKKNISFDDAVSMLDVPNELIDRCREYVTSNVNV